MTVHPNRDHTAPANVRTRLEFDPAFRAGSCRASRPAAWAALALLLAGAGALQAQEKAANPVKQPVAVDTTVVESTGDLDTAPSIDAAVANLSIIPGAVSVTDNKLVERHSVSTSADILAFKPGVFAAPPAGSGDGIKLSIRGSAIARTAGNFFRAGTLFTFDGLPVTGPGGTPYELFETYGLSYTEVLLGGNAFDYGALQIGGAINYVTKTGYTAAPFEVRVDAGSFGFRKYQLGVGRVLGKADYYFSATAFQTDGYQPNAHGTSQGFAGNFGYRFSDRINTRFYLRYRTTENDNPGNISLSELQASSRSPNPDNVVGRVNRVQPGSTWVANKTEFKIDPDSKLELGLVFHDAPIDIAPKASPGTATNALADRERSIWKFRDITFQGRYDRHDTFGTFGSDTTVAWSYADEYYSDVNVYANNPNVTSGIRAFRTRLKTAKYSGSADAYFRINNRLALTKELSLISGGALVYLKRASEVTYSAFSSNYTSLDRHNYYFAPRLGLQYEFSPDLAVFGNVTRSLEGPNSWQLNRGSQGNFYLHDDIRDQQAFAYEVGTRAQFGPFTGQISLFRTNLKDELLSIALVPGNPAAGSITYNGSKTYKQGIEVGLDTTVWTPDAWFRKASKEQKTKLSFNQSYSYNDFGYKNDPTFGKNELPGVPRQFYQGGLSFEHATGFFASASLFHASSYFVDFANTLEAPAYTIYNLNIGYTAPKGNWQVYLEVRNLTDKSYASSAGPTFYAGATEAARLSNRLFQGGDGRAINAGITLRF